MNLGEYFEKFGVRITWMAEKLNVSPKTIYDAIEGSDMRLSTAFKIFEITKGEVDFHDLYFSIKSKKRDDEINPTQQKNKKTKK